MIGDGDAHEFVQAFRVGEKGRGVTIRAHAQGHHIKDRHFRAFQAKALADIKFISGRSLFRLELPANAKDLAFAQGNFVQQRLTGHAVIAVRVIGRHTTFVDPIELQVFPGNLLAVLRAGIGQERKRILGSVAAGDGDARLAPGAPQPHECRQ